MHNEPQISRNGEWGDVTTLEDNRGKTNYYCRCCEYHTRIKEKIIDHYKKCIIEHSNKIENIDYVNCKICNFNGKTLTMHLKTIHNLSTIEYKEKYNSEFTSQNTKNKHAEIGRTEGIKKFEKARQDPNFYKKMGDGIKKCILNNSKERERRANQIRTMVNKIWQDPEYKEKMSKIAKKTSLRQDVIESRTNQLRNWRENNKEEFFNKCTLKMLKWLKNNPEKAKLFQQKFISSYDSYPEKMLFSIVCKFENFKFKRNKFIHSEIFNTKTNNKQVDILDFKNKIVIEFDGPCHFKPIFGEEKLKECKIRDSALNSYINENSMTLIRVGYDQFISKSKKETSYFKQDCLDKIQQILKDNVSGVYKIGEVYNE